MFPANSVGSEYRCTSGRKVGREEWFRGRELWFCGREMWFCGIEWRYRRDDGDGLNDKDDKSENLCFRTVCREAGASDKPMC